MSSKHLIDAQFDRAVEIVQGLPKTGPIQTDYEEKLTMYSLYKQATVGNVKTPRPGMWDMLGRAKWHVLSPFSSSSLFTSHRDAWNKHKDLDPYEAKWLYVEALLKVLRKYSDKTIAKNLVQELESYNGDPSHIVMSRTLSSTQSDSSSESDAEEAHGYPGHLSQAQVQPQLQPQTRGQAEISSEEEDDEDDDEDDEGDDQANPLPPQQLLPATENRPHSSLSLSSHQTNTQTQRYRTPLAMSPPPSHSFSAPVTQSFAIPMGVPNTQPLPGFETPSAFAPTSASVSASTFTYPESTSASSPNPMYGPQAYRPQPVPINMGVIRPASSIALERALEHMQAQLAAFNERLEVLESRTLSRSGSGQGTPRTHSFHNRNNSNSNSGINWDPSSNHGDSDMDLGLWSLVVNPVLNLIYPIPNPNGNSPWRIILRRLFLDASFLVCVLGLLRLLWKRSGVRRREVLMALGVLWRALVGRRERLLVDRGV
ncbi:hypothetical protein VNI00_001040 [Paramarasmius palmivorus]|uniref:ACB domain-containing protein n=1 Tax=Paramarasmius palmivorus TaxID=297713 RepID=A0AAW0E5W0_9AGAR